MPSYTLELELLGVYMTDMPGFEIWADGAKLGATYSISSSGTSITVNPSYGGALPSSLEFRFNDALPEAGRTIEIQSVKINDRYVNTGNFLSSDVLTNGGNATVNIAAGDFIFDISAEPPASEFTTGATQTFTAGADRYYGHTETTAEVFDMLGGNDTAYTGAGNDKVSGGAGNDLIRSNGGDDLLFGDAGNDRIYAGDGNDYVHGGDDNDFLFGNDGDDELHGGAGIDRIYGHADNDILTGGDGNDTLGGGAGDDSLFGDAGDDFLIAGQGNDTVDGGDGADVVYGGTGDDIIDGGDGNDTLIGNQGMDTIDGGDGDDLIYLFNNDFVAGEVIRGRAGDDDLILANAMTVDFTTGTVETIEDLIGSDADQDVTYTIEQALNFTNINLNGGNDTSRVQINGTVDVTALGTPTVTNVENGYLTGSTGDDDLTISGAQLDALIFGAGTINFDTGNDVLNLTSTSTDLNTFGNTDGSITGLEEIDASSAGLGVIIDVNAQTEDFILTGGANNDTITGGEGNDTIDGGNGTNTLFGGLGDDVIDGGAGNDTIYVFDASVNTEGDSLNAVNEIIFNENFSSGTGAFSYTDGGFGGTDGDNVSVTGNRITTDGDITGSGALRVLVDGQNDNAYTNGSGSWDASYSATSNLTNVQMTFSYRHIHSTRNDTGEDSQVWFEFDGTTYSTGSGNTFLSEAYGADGATDTGWIRVTIDLPDLTSGSTYNLSMGILHLGSSLNDEDAEVRFDDIVMTAGTAYGAADTTTADADSGSTNVVNGGGGNDTIYGSAGINTLNGDAGDDDIYSGTVADEVIFNDTFDASAGVYTYTEGTGVFGGNSASNAYVSGAYDAVDGADNAGSVAITLGGIDNNNINDMSGAWQRSFTLTEAKNDLVLTFDYHLYDSQTASTDPFDNNEDIQLYADINGTTYSNDANPYFFELLGADSFDSFDSGWVKVSLNVGSLGAGTHTLSLGALLTRKTFQPEEYTVGFDDVTLVDTSILNVNTLNGGDGLDTLYGSSGRDVFMFEAATAYNDLDVIENFGYTLDAIDISDLLTGYTAGTDDINDFVQLTESGGNTTISVDANGAAGGASFSDVTIINGVTGIDLDVMEIDGTLIV